MIEPIEPGDIRETDTILDVRRHPGHEQIRGALRYDPKRLLEAPQLQLPLNVEGRIVLHADSRDEAEEFGRRLIAMGARDVRLLLVDLTAWREAGRQIEGATREQPIPGLPQAGVHLL